MLDGTELCVVLKLVSGENVMAVLQDEDERYVELLHPMTVRSMPITSNRETVVAAPLCQFCDDETFLIDKRNVLFIKKLSSSLIPHYHNMIEEFGEGNGIKETNQQQKKSSWEEEFLEKLEVDKTNLH